MKREENVSLIIGSIGDRYIHEAAMIAMNGDQETKNGSASSAARPAKKTVRIRWGVLAACFAAVIAASITVTAFAVEAREYKAAVSFFAENGLSTEGLTRSEVKEVYRDITTKSFSSGKTAEVLRHAVPGWEIEQSELVPSELAELWDRNVRMNAVSDKGICYRIDGTYVMDEQKGFEVLEKSILECYRDGSMIWSAAFEDFYVVGHAYTEEGTVVWGRSKTFSSEQVSYGWIAFVNGEGTVAWQRRLEHGFQLEDIASVLPDGDGTLAVISRGDAKYVCLSRYDIDGNELYFHQTEVGNFGIRNSARLGDGYIVQLWNQWSGDTALLYKMDREGVLTDTFSYEADDCDYQITDMIELGGQIYLSAYVVPKQKNEGGRYEIADILGHVFSQNGKGADITSEELTPLVRDNYTAILLLCDPDGGTPKTFYSVKGSLGGKLNVSGSGDLVWNVESIASTFFSPLTSSFTIGGTCKVFSYTFDATGNLTGKTDTGETVAYSR